MPQARAITKYVRIQPKKAREVINLIRGEKAEKALGILQFCNRKSARAIEKTLRSAIANAENNLELDLKTLLVSEARIDEGPVLKPLRIKTRARYGRDAIRKRTSHISIVLDSGTDSEATETSEQ